MKITKYFLIPVLLGISLVHIAFANSLPKPDACPAADEIKRAGISFVAQQCGSQKWVAVQVDRYSTPQSWELIMSNIDASSQAEALKNAKAGLESISNDKGPTYDSEMRTWYCTYNNTSGYPTRTYVTGPQRKHFICTH